MKESSRSWPAGRAADADDTDADRSALEAALTLLLLPVPLLLLLLLLLSLRPVTRSNDDGDTGEPSGVESGVDEAESDVLSLVVRLRKMGMLDDCCCCRLVVV